jgi:DNA-binding IclR family transcriptional regulator
MNRNPRVPFWFRVPDVESGLMTLKRAELCCYLVVLKSIQRDRNGGWVSVRQAAQRARINPTSAQRALASLAAGGWLIRHGERQAGYTYSLPFLWMGTSVDMARSHNSQIKSYLETMGSPAAKTRKTRGFARL